MPNDALRSAETVMSTPEEREKLPKIAARSAVIVDAPPSVKRSDPDGVHASPLKLSRTAPRDVQISRAIQSTHQMWDEVEGLAGDTDVEPGT